MSRSGIWSTTSGRSFLAEAPQHVPGLRQLTAGLWQVSVFSHPLFLVSTQELQVERESLPLHVLAGLADSARETVKTVLQAEPALWPSYGPWLFIHEPALWREISQMVTQQQGPSPLDFRPLVEYLKETGNLKRLLEDVGLEQMWAALSPEEREHLRRLPEQETPPRSDPT